MKTLQIPLEGKPKCFRDPPEKIQKIFVVVRVSVGKGIDYNTMYTCSHAHINKSTQ